MSPYTWDLVFGALCKTLGTNSWSFAGTLSLIPGTKLPTGTCPLDFLNALHFGQFEACFLRRFGATDSLLPPGYEFRDFARFRARSAPPIALPR